MNRNFRFFPILIICYLPFHFSNSVAELPNAALTEENSVFIELSGYFDESSRETILYWSAQKCKIDGHFVVERREADAAYHKIDSIECAQDGDLMGNYEYVDAGDFSACSILNYRIGYKEKDGSLSYSNEIQLSPGGTSGFKGVQLYPNPAANDFTVEFNTKFESGEIVVYDLLGEEIARKPFKGLQQKLLFDCSNWAAGIYNLLIYAGDENLQLRLSIRRIQI